MCTAEYTAPPLYAGRFIFTTDVTIARFVTATARWAEPVSTPDVPQLTI
jgi:hypothetical protein